MATVIQSAQGEEKRNYQNKVSAYAIRYLVSNAASKEEAFAVVHAQAPGSVQNLRYAGMKFEGRTGDLIEITAQYEEGETLLPDSGDVDAEPTISFDCSAVSKHILCALEQTKHPNSAKDSGNMIGWNGRTGREAEYAGVNIVTASMRIAITKKIRMSKINRTFMSMIANLTGKVNDAPFRDWNAGEVLFLGASYTGVDKRSEQITVTYHFAIQLNEPRLQIEIQDQMQTLSKKGWQYLWYISEQREDASTLAPRNLITGAYLATIYPEANFSPLGLSRKTIA
ncbi:MAG: hypothetical protein PHS41_10790 [Victivallaceae bacterium]|nr:hypothetical protein [Victivallaceae bacterium]